MVRWLALWRRMACASILNYGPGEDDLAREAEAASEGAAHADEVFDQRIDRTDAAGEVVHRRRYRAAASGGGVAGSGRGDLRTDGSRAQRALWNAQHCVAQSGEPDDARAAIGSRTKECWRSASKQSWTRRAAARWRTCCDGRCSWLSGRACARAASECRWDLCLRCCTSGWRGPRGASSRSARS